MGTILAMGMQGLGDNIYQRAVIRERAASGDRIYLETPWPQFYYDIPNILPVKPNTRLRTQAKNTTRSDLLWNSRPRTSPSVRQIRPHYVGSTGTMLQGLCDAWKVSAAALTFDLPKAMIQPVDLRTPYVIVRPATVREEWRADSRNPLPEYLDLAAQAAAIAGYTVISIADLVPNVEWALEPLPFAHETYHNGEFNVEELMSMTAGAAGLIGGVGWIAPAAVALQRPTFLIYGGWGVHNGPARIFDKRLDTRCVTNVIPDRFCMCTSRAHNCDKRISRINQQIENWLLGIPIGAKAAVVA